MQRPHKAYPVELAQFHSVDYVEFLHRITPDTQHLFLNELAKCIPLFLSFKWLLFVCEILIICLVRNIESFLAMHVFFPSEREI